MTLTNQELKEIVTATINRHDPISLLEGGAPDNERESEISQVFTIVTNNDNLDTSDLATKIEEIFQDSFGGNMQYDRANFPVIAKDLLNQ